MGTIAAFTAVGLSMTVGWCRAGTVTIAAITRSVFATRAFMTLTFRAGAIVTRTITVFTAWVLRAGFTRARGQQGIGYRTALAAFAELCRVPVAARGNRAVDPVVGIA